MIEGKEAKSFYILRKGTIQLSRSFQYGDLHDAVLQPGAIFGVVPTMAKRSYLETAITEGEADVIEVPVTGFSELIERNSGIALKIINTFSKRLRHLNNILSKQTYNQKKGPVIEPPHLFDVGEYYANQSLYNQAYYAYFRYVQHCPSGPNVGEAQQKMEKIKPYVDNLEATDQNSSEFVRQYKKGEMIFAEGEPGEECYILQKGSVKISIIAENNEKVFVVLKNGGDIFGEMALLEDAPRSASATAAEDDTVLMAVNKGNFEKVVVEQPAMVGRLTELLSDRIWAVFKQLGNTLIESPVGKLFDALCTELEKDHQDYTIKKPYTFGIGPDNLIKMVGLDKSEGKEAISKLFEEAQLEIKTGKIHSSNITLIKKSSDFHKRDAERKRNIAENRKK